MAKQRVLVISQFYAPDITAAAFRISETVALLRAAGHDVRVIAAEPHKAQAEPLAGSATPRAARSDKVPTDLVPSDSVPSDSGELFRVAIRPYRGGGAVNYILHYLSFVVNAIRAGIRLRRSGWRADVVWVSSPPLFVGLAGDVVARIMRAPMVLDVRDIWPESAVGAGMIKHGSLLFRAGKVLEYWIYKRAARMTCVSRTMQDYLVAASGKPVDVVYNGVSASAGAAVSPIKIERRILYAGNLGRAQGIDTLIKAFAAARSQTKILQGWTIDLIGAGAVEKELRALAVSLGLGDAVRFRGVVDKPAAIAETRASAALFINLVDDAAFALTVPSKVFDCLLVDRPILYGVGGAEARAILAESGGNKAFAPSDVASLTTAIIELADNLARYENAARGNSKIVQALYTRETATNVLMGALEAAVPKPSDAVHGISRIARIVRNFQFARHIPPARIISRLRLSLQRRWHQRFPAAALPVPAECSPAAGPPLPLLPARGDLAAAADGSLTVTLVGQPMRMAAPIPWTAPQGAAAERLRWMTLNYMEYLEGADDAAFALLVSSWLDAVKPYSASFYRESHNSYALSLRAVVWMQQLARRPALAVALRQRMTHSLAGQLQFLAQNLETDIGGNHLIKNIKALLWGSVFFEGATADQWRKTGVALLARELPHQVLADGMHYERSPSYHTQVFADLLEVRYALGADPLAGALDRRLAAMAQATADMMQGDGRVAQFNDAGLSMSYPPAAVLNAYAKLFGKAPGQRSVFSYPDAGYFGRASASSVFVCDCGAIGPSDLPGHGHGDILSFEWSVGGQRIIVDQGVHSYVAGPRRAASRAAASHNTLAIDGRDQADFFGDFRAGRRPRATLRRYEARPDGFVLEGSHDGFAPQSHSRTFDVSGARVAIADRVEGGLVHGVRTGLLLHPSVAVVVMQNGPLGSRMRLTAAAANVIVQSSVPLTLEPAVWWPDMGVEFATQRIVALWPTGRSAAELTLTVE